MNNGYHRLIAYLGYLGKSSTRFRVHSPFVYSFIENVLKGDASSPELEGILNLRKELLHDRAYVLKSDYGSGGDFRRGYRTTVRSLARHSSAGKRQIGLFYRISRNLKPERVLELGTSLGLSAAAFSAGSPDARIVSVEGSPEIAHRAVNNLRGLNCRNVEVVTGEFDATIDDVLAGLEKVDLVYFDGNHKYVPTLAYFHKCLEYACNGSLFVFDDIHWSAEMTGAWQVIRSHPACRVTIDTFGMGFVFFRKELSVQHFVLRY